MYLTIVKAVILLLKHATTLLLSKGSKESLIKAGLDYQKANIGLKIQAYLMAFTPEDSVENFADFIMTTNIGLFLYIHLYDLISSVAKTVHREDSL